MSTAKQTLTQSPEKQTCIDVGEFPRLKYFYGQMLSPQDFQTEQNYFREKLKLHNRCLEGYGVLCGLLVSPVPFPKDCDEDKEIQQLENRLSELQKLKSGNAPNAPADLDAQIEQLQRELDDLKKRHCLPAQRVRVRIACGLALDCEGNDLIVHRPLVVDLQGSLSADDYKRVGQGENTLYISLCYCEQPVDPVRPVLPEACGAVAGCTYAKVQDSVRVKVTVDPPLEDARCESCCEPCIDDCLLLAKITGFEQGKELQPDQIHNEVRRPLSRYVPTVITGVSWKHGYEYTQDEAKEILGTDYQDSGTGNPGLEIRFSRPVRVSTIRPGVMDTWVIAGGKGNAGSITHKKGTFFQLPSSGTTDRIVYQDDTGEVLEPGDRLLIMLRTDFILDECCRPVDGENVGGRVPVLEEFANKYSALSPGECEIPPAGYGPWHSGDGRSGGTFESWFYIKEKPRDYAKGSREAAR